MFKNCLIIAFRNIFKHKVYSFINIAGFTIGILCSLLIVLLIQYELSYDRHYENAKNIYRVITQWPMEFMNTDKITWTSALLAPAINEYFPDVVHSSRIEDTYQEVSLSFGRHVFSEEKFYFVDPDFLQMFSTQFLKGHPENALTHPLSVIISEEMALKYFAGENPLGKFLRYNNKFDFQVTGVFENVPENSHFRYDFLASFLSLRTIHGEDAIYMDRWTSMDYQTYIQLREGTDTQEFEKSLEKYLVEITPQSMKDYNYFLQPVTKIHLSGNLPGELAQNSHIKYVYILTGIALLVILITCFNYINLSTARFSVRAREINIRKVVGASRKHLMQQFIVETFLTVLITFGFALILLYFTLPFIKTQIGADFDFSSLRNINVAGSVVALICAVGLISAYYPALYISSLKSLSIIKTGLVTVTDRSKLSRNSLVIIQFIISTALIFSTITIHRQIKFIMESNLGQLNGTVVTLSVSDDNEKMKEKIDVFKSELIKEPDIKAVSVSSFLPANIRSGNWAVWEGQMEEEKILFHNLQTDYEFLDLYNLPVIEGRNFSLEFPFDREQAFIVNETAIRLMNMDDPIGKRFGYSWREGIIVGVVKDFHFVPMDQQIKPLAIRLNTSNTHYISIKIDSLNMDRTIQYIEEKWKDISPDFAFTYSFFEDAVDGLYQSEKRLTASLTLFSYIALFLASLGLFGLALFTGERRIKEIGVRKVFGAKIFNIVTLLLVDFLRWIFVANLIALPLAYYTMKHWLQSFAYRTTIGLWIFVLSLIISFGIAGITIIYQTIKAATANPVESLRYE